MEGYVLVCKYGNGIVGVGGGLNKEANNSLWVRQRYRERGRDRDRER